MFRKKEFVQSLVSSVPLVRLTWSFPLFGEIPFCFWLLPSFSVYGIFSHSSSLYNVLWISGCHPIITYILETFGVYQWEIEKRCLESHTSVLSNPHFDLSFLSGTITMSLVLGWVKDLQIEYLLLDSPRPFPRPLGKWGRFFSHIRFPYITTLPVLRWGDGVCEEVGVVGSQSVFRW